MKRVPVPLAVLAAFAILTAAGAGAVKRSALSAPTPFAPAGGATVQALSAFGWRGVGGEDHYEFQIGADPSFNSPVLGHGHDSFDTRNTWATLDDAIPNGTYWWHVRAVAKSGAVSSWSAARSIRKRWSYVPRLLSPSNGARIAFPTTPLVLRWSPVPYAAKYRVYLATDRDLGTLVGDKAIETEGLSYSPSVTLAIGTYYWAVTPVDAQGNRGARSRITSFRWAWNSQTTPAVRDLVAAEEHYDPQFSWTPVKGAARYEVQINPSHEWAKGSEVCCDHPVVTTTFSPTELLANNRYYWRVRAINVDGNAGKWNEGPSFNKTFDNVADPGVPTIKNLHVRDNYGNSGGPGVVTSSPIVVWDPVPGASKYEVEVVAGCDWTSTKEHWHLVTAVPAWTPLAANPNRPLPYPVPGFNVSFDSTQLVAGHLYCVRVRAYSDQSADRQEIFGNYTYLTNAFTFAGYPAGGSGLTASSYLAPIREEVAPWTPLLTWQPVVGAACYWVIVAKDRSFTTIVDYAATHIPAYAPRTDSKPRTYSDEETLYYWAILPATASNCTGAPPDPNLVPSAAFQKRSTPPGILQPDREGKLVVGPPTFRWTPALGARYYRLQVSQDSNFGTTLDDITTDSTAYTATKTYPANAALYFRVRAEDENKIGLRWSARRKFRNTLARPKPAADNPRRGEVIPTWTWRPVQGALSYDVHVDLPNGTDKDFSGDLLAAFTATEMRGTGVFRWQVRAEFPEAGGRKTAVGPYSRALSFTRTISAPSGSHAVVGARSVLLSWQPKIAAKEYAVQIASTPSFSRTVENEKVDGTSFAPKLHGGDWERGATFYWRVASVDAGGNSGNYTPVRSFRLRLPRSR